MGESNRRSLRTHTRSSQGIIRRSSNKSLPLLLAPPSRSFILHACCDGTLLASRFLVAQITVTRKQGHFQ